MKKISFILMALAMVMGMTQCKKEQPQSNSNGPELVGEKYEISLTLGGGSNAKAGVYPFEGAELNYAPVYFVQGDKIEVAYKGIRVGTLLCTTATPITSENAASAYNTASATFSGAITVDDSNIDGTSPLYFYFIGNNDYGTTSGKLIVDISDQTSSLPVISYAASKEPFAAATTAYTINNGYNLSGSNWLLNQCALVKFTCENIYNQSTNANDNNPQAIYTTDKVITLYGMENKVTIDLTNPGGENQFVWSSENSGKIKLYLPSAPEGETTEQAAARIATRYAIVHHGSYTKDDETLDVDYTPSTYQAHNDEYGFYGTYKLGSEESPVAIAKNQYYPDGEIDLVWHSGAFSINKSGEQVVFSRGNLQYAHKAQGTRHAETWRFAKHQYDWVGGELERNSGNYQGNVVANETGATSAQKSDNVKVGDGNYYGWIDLFGYGTTAYNPTLHTRSNGDYIISTGTHWEGILLVTDYRFDEWGNNEIVNSGTPKDKTWWTTLTKDECEYVFEDRSNAKDKIGFAEITMADGGDGFGNAKVRGLVVLPDYWEDGWHQTTWQKAGWDNIFVNGTSTDLDWPTTKNNVYTLAQWNIMESHGAVFLPCAGYRDTDTYDNTIVEYDGGHNEEQNRATYWSHGVQSSSAAYGLGFGYASGADWVLTGNHVNGNVGFAPDNGRSVRLVHKLDSGSKLGKIFGK